MFELTITKNRTEDFGGTLTDNDGATPAGIAATDVLRFKLGRVGSAPLLEISSNAVLAGGSTITITQTAAPAAYTLRIAQADTASLDIGSYSAELILIDDSETAPPDAAKLVESGIVHVAQGMLGSL